MTTDPYHAGQLVSDRKINRENAIIDCFYDKKNAIDKMTDIVMDARRNEMLTLRKNGNIYQHDIHEVIWTRGVSSFSNDVWQWKIMTQAEIKKWFKISTTDFHKIIS